MQTLSFYPCRRLRGFSLPELLVVLVIIGILVLIALLNTIISLYYYLLVVKAMFINKNDTPIESFRSDGYTRVSLVACSAGILLLGILSVVYDQISLLAYGM